MWAFWDAIRWLLTDKGNTEQAMRVFTAQLNQARLTLAAAVQANRK